MRIATLPSASSGTSSHCASGLASRMISVPRMATVTRAGTRLTRIAASRVAAYVSGEIPEPDDFVPYHAVCAGDRPGPQRPQGKDGHERSEQGAAREEQHDYGDRSDEQSRVQHQEQGQVEPHRASYQNRQPGVLRPPFLGRPPRRDQPRIPVIAMLSVIVLWAKTKRTRTGTTTMEMAAKITTGVPPYSPWR